MPRLLRGDEAEAEAEVAEAEAEAKEGHVGQPHQRPPQPGPEILQALPAISACKKDIILGGAPQTVVRSLVRSATPRVNMLRGAHTAPQQTPPMRYLWLHRSPRGAIHRSGSGLQHQAIPVIVAVRTSLPSGQARLPWPEPSGPPQGPRKPWTPRRPMGSHRGPHSATVPVI